MTDKQLQELLKPPLHWPWGEWIPPTTINGVPVEEIKKRSEK